MTRIYSNILCNVQIWGWDPGFWIRYSVTPKNSIPDPGTGVYKALDTDEVTSRTLTEGKAPFQLSSGRVAARLAAPTLRRWWVVSPQSPSSSYGPSKT